ncbi:MAG TPA: hypothetical protein VIJ92_10585 [Ginsengibacter sp.]
MRTSILHKFINWFSILCATVLLHASSFGQLNKIDNITNSYIDYVKNHLSEKIFVHTDRSYYFCGDILWFKIYLANNADNKLLSISKVAYVEVLNTMHQPVLQGKIAMENGTGSGSFDVPSSLSSGNYELRAYTNWMRNDSADHYFKKIITIINTTQNLDTSLVHRNINYVAQFFPEGGNLVNGLNSTVAFKINDNYGKGVDCEGMIIDQSNDTVARFRSSHFGMGQFLLTPQNGKHYKAVIMINDSSIITKELPEAYDKGYVMHVSEVDTHQLKITVQSANVSFQDSYLLAETRQHIDFAEALHLENNQAVFIIDKDKLADGMAQITLFNQDREPVCERLYFKRPKNKMLIQAKANKQNYTHRDKINIDLLTTNQSGDSLGSNLSVSVYRLDSLQQPSQENVFSYLWLSSNCRGYIENTDYYFKNDDAQTNADLDNLLLTQGWRKFDWKNILQTKTYAFNYIPENYGHIITGRITNDITGKAAAGILVYLSVPGKRIEVYGSVSDVNGLIHFDMKDFYGANQVVLQTNTTKDSAYHLEVFSAFSEKYSDSFRPSLHVSENNSNELQAANLHMKVENAYHQKEIQLLQPLLIDTLPFYYKPSKTYLLDDYTRFTTMEEVLREYVAEVNVSRRGKKYHLFTLNQPAFEVQGKQTAQIFFDTNPLMLLDGVPVFDADNIIAYDPLKVQKLEVVTAKYHWGPIVADGIVSYTTYKGNLNGYTLNPHDLVVDYEGLQQQRIFYSPDYAAPGAIDSRLPDFRDVLYWSPEINTSKKGDGQVSFYTGDISGKYLVELEGISSNGDAGDTHFILNVEK